MLKAIGFAIITSLIATTAWAADLEISPLQLQLAAWCGAKFSVLEEKGVRNSYGSCASDRQDIQIVGPADQPVAVQAQVDLRQKNIGQSHQFLIYAMRQLLADKDWPSAQRFIEVSFDNLLVPEKAERRFGQYALSVRRGSDVMITMVIAKGKVAHHPAFDW